jgi:transposase-like protein
VSKTVGATNATTEDVERALLEVARHQGSPKKAAEALAIDGWDVKPNTLSVWKKKHRDRYLEIEQRHRKELSHRTASTIGEQVGKLLDLSGKVYEEMQRRLDDPKYIEDLSDHWLLRYQQQLAVDSGIKIDKMRDLTGEAAPPPPQNPVILIAELKRMGVIEGEATEIRGDLEPGD